MTVPNFLGILVIEALKEFGKPVLLADIISKVASFQECSPKQVEDLVIKTVNGGVHYGFIQKCRNKFACFPINLSGLTDDDNLYASRKKKARNSPITNTETSSIAMNNEQGVDRVNLKDSDSAYKRSKLPSDRSSKMKHTSLNSRKGIRKSEPEPKTIWRI